MDNGLDLPQLRLYIIVVHHHFPHHHPHPNLQFLKFKKLLEKPGDKKVKLKKIISKQKSKISINLNCNRLLVT